MKQQTFSIKKITIRNRRSCVREKENMFPFQGKEYPPRVTRGSDWVYRWAGHADHEQKGEVVRIVMGVIGGICLFYSPCSFICTSRRVQRTCSASCS